MKKALIIIDVQNDYFAGGKCELAKPYEALAVIKKLKTYFRDQHFPIYYIQHIGDEGATFFKPNTQGANIHPEIIPNSIDSIIIKHTPNSFYQTNLDEQLKQSKIKELVIVGMMSHMCVDTTVRCAKDFGYDITLISDGCATKALEWDGTIILANIVQSVYMASLNGRFAKVQSSKDYLKI